jgi:hypothetical protein
MIDVKLINNWFEPIENTAFLPLVQKNTLPSFQFFNRANTGSFTNFEIIYFNDALIELKRIALNANVITNNLINNVYIYTTNDYTGIECGIARLYFQNSTHEYYSEYFRVLDLFQFTD